MADGKTAVDYQEQLLEAMRIISQKQVNSISFDKTVEATITDASKASEGVYTVSTGDAKFTAYSTETKYKKNDAVMVTIPQGNYDKQKMIIGKQVGNMNTPIIYKSPFQNFINISNNLIQEDLGEIGYYANGPVDNVLGKQWSIQTSDFSSSNAYAGDIVNGVIKRYGQIWDKDMFEQGFTRLAISAQFSTWLGEYDIISGNYGLVLKVTFQCQDLATNNTFDKFLVFDSNDFFGDVYNFETYYTQEKLFNIEDFVDYPIVHMTLFAYQRNNFKNSLGEENFYSGDLPWDDNNAFSTINPNIFVKSPLICLGVPAEDFETDTAEILAIPNMFYRKQLQNGETESQRYDNNLKQLYLRWVHKDTKTGIIKSIEPGEIPEGYEIRWYRHWDGAKSPDQFAGAHWVPFYGCKSEPNENTMDYCITDKDINNGATDIAADEISGLVFVPDINRQQEQLKAIIVKNEGTNNAPVWRKIASTPSITFINDNNVRSQQTIIDTNALSIRYDDDEKGHYFLYDEAGDIGKNEDSEVRSLTAVFDEDVDNVYEKGELIEDECSSIEWTFPDINANTMIIPMTGPDQDAQPATWNENGYWVDGNGVRLGQDSKQVGFTIKPHLDHNATSNTIQLDIVKDGLTYTAQIQPIFGIAGDNGSNYKLILTWREGKNAVNLSSGFDHTLVGDVVLFDQAGDVVDWPSGATLEPNWLVAEFGDSEIRQKEQEKSNYYYPILANSNALIDIANNPDSEYQQAGYYYFTPDGATDDYVYFDAVNKIFSSSNNDTIPYRACRSDGELKNKIDFRKITFTEDPVDPETGTYKVNYFSDHPNPIEYDLDKHKKRYYYSQTKKFFIKINDQYILDPWQDYQEVETYYEPIEAKEKSYTVDSVGNAVDGLTVTVNGKIVTVTANSNVSMNSLFVLSLTLKNFGDYDLTAYYPIPLKNGETKDGNQITKKIQYIEGPDRVRYSSAGETSFNKNPYKITILKYDENNNIVKYRHGYTDEIHKLLGYWKLLFITSGRNYDEDNFKPVLNETAIDPGTNQIKTVINERYDIPLLNPVSVYIPDAIPYGIQFVEINGNNEQVLWTQPILVYENKYPSATLNKWNGKDIETDNDAGTITASGFAAGRKERDNTFTGVVIGDWSRSVADAAIAKNTGIYGFNSGAMSYAFKDDGTGFIGKDGKGRIYLDGDKSQIFSSNWANKNNPQGMLLDIDDGYIKMQSIDTTTDVYTRITENVKDKYFSWIDGYTVKPLTQADNPFVENGSSSDPLTLYIKDQQSEEYTPIDSNKKIKIGDIVYFDQSDNSHFKILSNDRNSNDYILKWFTANNKDTFNSSRYSQRLYKDSYGSQMVQEGDPYLPDSAYYLKESGTRYITIGANQPKTPLSIGTEKNVSQRRFRVDWNGKLHVVDGDFSGDITGSNISGGTISGGYITGSSVYATYLDAQKGNIGGWTINSDSLSGGETVLRSSKGIATNVLEIRNSGSRIGSMGQVSGHAIKQDTNEIYETTLLGIQSDNADIGISLETKQNVRISGLWNEGTNKYDKVNGFYLWCDSIEFHCDDQRGIYARFA